MDGVEYTYYYMGDKLARMTVGDSLTMDFFYDQNGRPYAMKYNSLKIYYVLNQQGDVVRLVTASGSSYGIYTYDAWGNILYTSDNQWLKDNPLRYRGYVYDTETELYYCQSRYYDPATGRFINTDTFTSTGQGILGNNMFAYCRNNPVCRVDVSGAFDEECNPDDPDALDPIQGSHGAGGGANTSPTMPGSVTTSGHATNGGTPDANPLSGSHSLSFKTEDLLKSHFSNHNKDFGNAFASKEEYLETANYVIQNGKYLNESNAYVKFYGYQGHANYAYVGLTRDMQYITTFHLRHASKIFEREGL